MMEGSGEFRYFAFISYSSKDLKWGKRLQRKLEGYRMPSTLCSERGWKRKPMKPTFFAATDIQPGDLSEELKARLRSSRNLIVICSPDSARSEWVGKEIAYFHELGRDRDIHFFIIRGEPHSGDAATECFNPVLERLDMPDILAANIHERIYRWPWMNRERAYVQLISKMLEVEFDTLWRRHRRMMIRRAVLWTAGVLGVAAALTGVWLSQRPADVSVRLREVSESAPGLAPMRDAVVTMSVGGETKSDTVSGNDATALFLNIPGKYLGREARISVACDYFYPTDTVVTLSRDLTVAMRRDPRAFGEIRVELFDEATGRSVAGMEVSVEGMAARSDSDGIVRMNVPLARQKPCYAVSIGSTGQTDTIYMPRGEGDVIVVRN